MVLNTNVIKVIGELVEIKSKKDLVFKDGREGASASVIIKSIVNDKEVMTEVSLLSSKFNKDGQPAKLYTAIENLENMLNKKVVGRCKFNPNRFWDTRKQQLVNANKVEATWIGLANNKDVDEVSFTFGGFIHTPLQEVLDENGDVRYFKLTMGQANYNGTNMILVDFIVNKEDTAIIKAVQENYEQYSTVEINGVCQSITTSIKKEKPTLIGEPITTVYNNTRRNWVLKNGSELYTGGEEAGEYTEEILRQLLTAYKESGAAIQASAAATTPADAMTTPKKPIKASLAGLI